jgi:hypothetical protein
VNLRSARANPLAASALALSDEQQV